MRARDITGMRSGRLVAIKRIKNKKGERTKWLCQCDCGNTHIAQTWDIVSGHTKSCGCKEKERIFTHGRTGERLYVIWNEIKYRCYNPNCKQYKYYGGKGIKLCDEWRHEYENFRAWAYSNGYDDKAKKYECTIDRIDVNGNYEPSNCRWVDMYVQASNTVRNHYITLNGETHTITQWARITGLSRSTIHKRLKKPGSTPESALSLERKGGWYRENGHIKKSERIL